MAAAPASGATDAVADAAPTLAGLRARIEQTDKHTPTVEINAILTEMGRVFPACYIHPQQVSFASGQARSNARPFLDDEMLAHSHNYNQFVRGPTGGKVVRLALFTTHTHSWLYRTPEGLTSEEARAQRDADWSIWHTWAAAWIGAAAGRGRTLLIFDNDAAINAAPTSQAQLMGAIQNLIQAYRKNQTPPREVWASAAHRQEEGKDRCLRDSLLWMVDVAQRGGGGWRAEGDARSAGLVLLPRS